MGKIKLHILLLGIFLSTSLLMLGAESDDNGPVEIVVVDGVTYNIYENSQGNYYVYVGAPKDGSKYRGDIVIANEIEYNGKMLPVKYIMSDFEGKQLNQRGAFTDTPDLNRVTLGDNICCNYHTYFVNSGIREVVFPKEYFLWVGPMFENCPNLTAIHLTSKFTQLGTDMWAEFPNVAVYFDGAVEAKCFGEASEVYFGNQPIYAYNRALLGVPLNETEGLQLSSKMVLGQFALEQTEARWVEFPVAEPIEDVIYWYNGKWNTIGLIGSRLGVYVFNQAKSLERIICRDPQPWSATESTFLFDTTSPDDMTLYRTCTLCVPAEAIETYKADPVWGKFERIEAIEDGVDDITVDMDVVNNEDRTIEYYDLTGRKVAAPTAGQMVIRRQGDAVTKLIAK